MSHTNIQHRRTHNLLLISKLLSQRDAASPFTLVLDSLEQTATPLIKEYIRRAGLAKTHIIFLGFESIKPPNGVDTFIACYDKTPAQIGQAVSAAMGSIHVRRHHLLVIDSLYSLCTLSLQLPSTTNNFNLNLTHFLSSLIAPVAHTISMVAVYHTDIPLPAPSQQHVYHPTPLSLLQYLATTILTTHSLATVLSAKAAQDRSLAAPVYGLDENKEGVVIGLKPPKFTRHLPTEQRGLILELEHRRKSGRGVKELYFLPSMPSRSVVSGAPASKEQVTLLDDHPLFRPKKVTADEGDELAGMTFELGLTDRQRMEREGVVLPYFDAQREGGTLGSGEGGRILYDMGFEDDFDEEEDEI